MLTLTLTYIDCLNPSGNFCDKDYCGTESAGYEAIKWIHRQLDDDASGDIDLQETDEVSDMANQSNTMQTIVSHDCLMSKR